MAFPLRLLLLRLLSLLFVALLLGLAILPQAKLDLLPHEGLDALAAVPDELVALPGREREVLLDALLDLNGLAVVAGEGEEVGLLLQDLPALASLLAPPARLLGVPGILPELRRANGVSARRRESP